VLLLALFKRRRNMEFNKPKPRTAAIALKVDDQIKAKLESEAKRLSKTNGVYISVSAIVNRLIENYFNKES